MNKKKNMLHVKRAHSTKMFTVAGYNEQSKGGFISV